MSILGSLLSMSVVRAGMASTQYATARPSVFDALASTGVEVVLSEVMKGTLPRWKRKRAP